MSLLMDALKRAESNKQQAGRTLPSNDGVMRHPEEELRLEPLGQPGAKGDAKPLPDLANHLDELEADLTTAALSPTPQRPGLSPKPVENPKHEAEREAIRNAFAAKLVSEPPSRKPLWLALGTLAVAALGISAYVWYQLNTMGRSGLAGQAQTAAPPLPTTTTAVSGAAMPAPAPLRLNTNTVLPAAVQSTAGNATIPGKAPGFPPIRGETRTTKPVLADNTTERQPAIRFSRSLPESDANLAQGHNHLQSNQLDSARHDFEQVLQRDPNNTDALLALAAIAQRQGRFADAEQLHQLAMIANPSDAAVQAASLNGITASTNPQSTESRLKTLIAAQPDSAQLNFVLGNLYSRQNRWAEAQQVYFNAVAADGDNPDYLFNLGVSLDHLRQGRLAAQHYRLALDAAERRPAAFDATQVRRRLAELQP